MAPIHELMKRLSEKIGGQKMPLTNVLSLLVKPFIDIFASESGDNICWDLFDCVTRHVTFAALFPEVFPAQGSSARPWLQSFILQRLLRGLPPTDDNISNVIDAEEVLRVSADGLRVDLGGFQIDMPATGNSAFSPNIDVPATVVNCVKFHLKKLVKTVIQSTEEGFKEAASEDVQRAFIDTYRVLRHCFPFISADHAQYLILDRTDSRAFLGLVDSAHAPLTEQELTYYIVALSDQEGLNQAAALLQQKRAALPPIPLTINYDSTLPEDMTLREIAELLITWYKDSVQGDSPDILAVPAFYARFLAEAMTYDDVITGSTVKETAFECFRETTKRFVAEKCTPWKVLNELNIIEALDKMLDGAIAKHADFLNNIPTLDGIDFVSTMKKIIQDHLVPLLLFAVNSKGGGMFWIRVMMSLSGLYEDMLRIAKFCVGPDLSVLYSYGDQTAVSTRIFRILVPAVLAGASADIRLDGRPTLSEYETDCIVYKNPSLSDSDASLQDADEVEDEAENDEENDDSSDNEEMDNIDGDSENVRIASMKRPRDEDGEDDEDDEDDEDEEGAQNVGKRARGI